MLGALRGSVQIMPVGWLAVDARSVEVLVRIMGVQTLVRLEYVF